MSDDEKPPEQITSDDELRRYARAEPFVPFDIVTTSGMTYPISESLQVAAVQNTVVVVLPRTGVTVIRKSQIVALHKHEPVE